MWQPEADTVVAHYRAPRPGGDAHGPQLPEDALDLSLERRVGGGLIDRWTIDNRSGIPWQGHLRLEIDADFADIAEVGREPEPLGEVASRLVKRTLQLTFDARRRGRHLRRGVRVHGDVRPDQRPGDDGERALPQGWALDVADGGFVVRLRLDPAERAIATFRVSSLVDGKWRSPDDLAARPDGGSLVPERDAWRLGRMEVDGPPALEDAVERALDDLFALRNRDLEADLLGPSPSPRARWVVNAGVPTFTGFFGRDALTAGWQSAMAGTAALEGAIDVVARTQATDDDPWRDAAPGKMLHELRRGPRSMLGISPRDAYFGTQTTPAFFVVVLSELWHWTGDDSLLRRYRNAAVRAVEWAERTCDQRGFVTYLRRSPGGLENQGWKDSNEAIRHTDGSAATAPMATVEEQAFHFLALQRLAEIHVALDQPAAAEPLLERARELRARWHEAFWMPDERFYALAIDGEGRRVGSIASNPGHALATGIVPEEHALEIADRLLTPALFSGWGVRTLSAEHPSYNPLAYHLGTVWPVENATFALGFKRYGLDDHLERLGTAILEGAAGLPASRLPEALTGHPRVAGAGPAPSPSACSPQAWSASAVIQILQLLLGLYPFAPLQALAIVRPRLPVWAPEVTVRKVRVGRASVDLQFSRRGDGSASWKVVRRDGPIHVVGAAPPADASGASGPWFEQLERALLARAPGRLTRAARIAVGLE